MFKFTHNQPVRDPKDARAFIDEDGDLVILDAEGGDHMCLMKDGCILPQIQSVVSAKQDRGVVSQSFYAGDSVTITFGKP